MPSAASVSDCQPVPGTRPAPSPAYSVTNVFFHASTVETPTPMFRISRMFESWTSLDADAVASSSTASAKARGAQCG